MPRMVVERALGIGLQGMRRRGFDLAGAEPAGGTEAAEEGGSGAAAFDEGFVLKGDGLKGVDCGGACAVQLEFEKGAGCGEQRCRGVLDGGRGEPSGELGDVEAVVRGCLFQVEVVGAQGGEEGGIVGGESHVLKS